MDLAGLWSLQGIGRRAKLLEGGRFSMQCVHAAAVSCTATSTNAAPCQTSTPALPSTSLMQCWWMTLENQLRTLSRRSCSGIVPNSLREKPPRCSGMSRELTGSSSSQIKLHRGFGLRTVATRITVMTARGCIVLIAATGSLAATPGTNSGKSRHDRLQSIFPSATETPLAN